MEIRNKITFNQILKDYEILEPSETDSWNPLKSDAELAYRLSLFSNVTSALRHCKVPLESLNILDIGCGNGRSTRMYIDLGLYPGQLTGIDLREGAISKAKKLHPTIDYRVNSDGDIPNMYKWNWIQVTLVFSSIKAESDRKEFAYDIQQKLVHDGYLFYYDMVKANKFAGGDRIDPKNLFNSLSLVWYHQFNELRYLPDHGFMKEHPKVNRLMNNSKIIRLIMRIIGRQTTIAKIAQINDIANKKALLFQKPFS